MNIKQIFKELKIIELAAVLAGPAVGMFFAEMGAEVIKIENKNAGGDLTRKWKLPSEPKDRDYSAYYCAVNYGKESLFLNIKDEADYQILIQLIQEADIVISNFREEQALKMKVDYPTLSTLNPKLIFAQLTGFGKESTRPAFDVVLQAEAGFMYMTGEPNRPPVKMPVALIDILAAHQLKEGILVALLKRYKTGRGSYVETSLYEAALASLANQASNWLMAEHIPQAMGTLHPNIAPYGEVFYSSDKKAIVLAVGTDKQFKQLCLALELDLFDDDKFTLNTNRVIHRIELTEYLSASISKLDIKSLENKFQEKDIPYGRIRNMKEVFETKESQKMILEDEKGKRVKTVAFTLSQK